LRDPREIAEDSEVDADAKNERDDMDEDDDDGDDNDDSDDADGDTSSIDEMST